MNKVRTIDTGLSGGKTAEYLKDILLFHDHYFGRIACFDTNVAVVDRSVKIDHVAKYCVVRIELDNGVVLDVADSRPWHDRSQDEIMKESDGEILGYVGELAAEMAETVSAMKRSVFQRAGLDLGKYGRAEISDLACLSDILTARPDLEKIHPAKTVSN